jgi:hypothetical protein
LVTEKHVVKISDFGVAKMVDGLQQVKRFSMQGSV